MSLRNLAAADRMALLDDPMGVGEDLTIVAPDGSETPTRGVWIDNPSDGGPNDGIGAISYTNSARCTLGATVAITRSHRIRRAATSTLWSIVHIATTAGVGYRLTLALPDETGPRGVR